MVKRARNQSREVMEALYFLPDGNPREFKDFERTVQVVRKIVGKYDLSYQAQVLLRAIINILICSGVSRAHSAQAIDKIFEKQSEAMPDFQKVNKCGLCMARVSGPYECPACGHSMGAETGDGCVVKDAQGNICGCTLVFDYFFEQQRTYRLEKEREGHGKNISRPDREE